MAISFIIFELNDTDQRLVWVITEPLFLQIVFGDFGTALNNDEIWLVIALYQSQNLYNEKILLFSVASARSCNKHGLNRSRQSLRSRGCRNRGF